MGKPPFIIMGLPRSRTFWLSKFLTYGEWHCGHEELRHARTMDDVKSWFSQPGTGTVETSAAPWWRIIRNEYPEVRVVTVRRPVDDVVNSLVRAGFDRGLMAHATRRMDQKLDQIECRVPGVMSIQFADLADEAVCARVFEHCLPYPHDLAWWSGIAPLNLQINMPALFRYYEAHYSQLLKLASIARHRTIAAMSRDGAAPEGITIQVEPFGAFLRDGKALFAEHLIQVGEAPDDYLGKNIPLMRALDQLGAMQITTARSNGRMFGYLMAVISPSLESPDVMSAMHTVFFASAEFPGLGMKLQRASVQALRERGVGEVFFRAGTRGSGPKMGALYRRMGAEDFGRVFKLQLKDAA